MPKAKALFLDLDGTVRTTKGGKPCPNHPSEQEVMPGRKEVIDRYRKEGYKILAVTNQGGIGLGYMSEKDCVECLKDLDKKLGGVFDKMYYAKAPPHKKDMMTKPNPGMLMQGAEDFDIDLKNSIMVGDRPPDQGAAKNAGVPFKWAKDFFGDS